MENRPLMDTSANTKVLVADDDRTIRRNLGLFLRSEGFQALEASDGDEALALHRRRIARRRAARPQDARPRRPGGPRRPRARRSPTCR